MDRKLPTVKEIFEMAQAAGYDSLGICVDPELQEILEKMKRDQDDRLEVRHDTPATS